jgi:hypothetical protein
LITLVAPVSTALAGTHYVEIWNPPEARLSRAGRPAHKQTPQRRAAKKPATRIAKVADPAHNSSTPAPAPKAEPGVWQSLPADTDEIPRIIGPHGRPMRVAYHMPYA